MADPRPQLISKEVAVLCAAVGILTLVIAVMVVIGLRNNETHSHELDGTITDTAREVDIAPASLVPIEE